jgi:hypothetical protein
VLLKDSELYRVRGNMRVVAVFYESEDASLSDGPSAIQL